MASENSKKSLQHQNLDADVSSLIAMIVIPAFLKCGRIR